MAPGLQRSETSFRGNPHGAAPPVRSTLSFVRRAQTAPPSQEAATKQETYPIYRLKWEKLKAFLERRFPGHQFQERVHKDRYVFTIPESLTSEEFDAIADERDKAQNEGTRVANSPEPA
ncbi:MAG: hypothetical protein M1816_005083 [Peltula sp. TS41687]|nr:MAG: hypothetical protein M1816_005083 [Peltula sp. TS41687]